MRGHVHILLLLAWLLASLIFFAGVFVGSRQREAAPQLCGRYTMADIAEERQWGNQGSDCVEAGR